MTLNLTLAIPVHDDLPGLLALLARAAQTGCVGHLVVVDDGSHTPLEKAALLGASGLRRSRLTLLRHDTARGPGAARNLALAHVPTEHLLFLDADDLMTPELPHLLRDLDGQVFDFCIFRHHDTRSERWGQMPHDAELWRAAGADVGALGAVSRRAAALLAQTANYPWNKIYRTGFLREHGIGCSELLVHEDIELHWMSFLRATRILASDRIGAIHHVSETGARLTNLRGRERLAVFGPLERIAQQVAARGDDPYAPAFHRFAIGLIDWISDNLHTGLQGEFATLADRFLRAHLPGEIAAGLARSDPGLMRRIGRMTGRDIPPA